jgi:hypothetical protein
MRAHSARAPRVAAYAAIALLVRSPESSRVSNSAGYRADFWLYNGQEWLDCKELKLAAFRSSPSHKTPDERHRLRSASARGSCESFTLGRQHVCYGRRTANLAPKAGESSFLRARHRRHGVVPGATAESALDHRRPGADRVDRPVGLPGSPLPHTGSNADVQGNIEHSSVPRQPDRRRADAPNRPRVEPHGSTTVKISTANGIRTRVTAVRGRRPSPLDDGGALSSAEASKARPASRTPDLVDEAARTDDPASPEPLCSRCDTVGSSGQRMWRNW